MESIALSRGGLIELIDHVTIRNPDWKVVRISGTRLDVVAWLDLFLSLAPEVNKEVMAIKKVLRNAVIHNYADDNGNYTVALKDLKRDFGTSEGIVSNPWFWTAL